MHSCAPNTPQSWSNASWLHSEETLILSRAGINLAYTGRGRTHRKGSKIKPRIACLLYARVYVPAAPRTRIKDTKAIRT